jgi:hypothetical protein
VIAEIVSLPSYEARVSTLMTDDERIAMEFFIACAPEGHPLIPDTGGFRKARWARPGKGKSGGLRVVYFFISPPGAIYRAHVYSKSRQPNLSAADRNKLAKLASQIKQASRRRH